MKDLFRLINDGSEAFGYSKEEFYEHDYKDFLGVLKKNKMKLTIDPARREPAEALRAELGASVGKLVPSMEQIERTDELIDAIVYRLYGLSEEEIRICGGKVS